jgi:hypothetical protein
MRGCARLPDCRSGAVALIRATGVIGDRLYIPWLIERMAEPAAARLAGEAFSTITGVDLAYRDLDRRRPPDFQSGPNDDPADENVALGEDDRLPSPDPGKVGEWWTKNKARFNVGRAYFLGTPKGLGGLARRSLRRVPASAPGRRPRTGNPPAQPGNVRGPRRRPSAAAVAGPCRRVAAFSRQFRVIIGRVPAHEANKPTVRGLSPTCLTLPEARLGSDPSLAA